MVGLVGTLVLVPISINGDSALAGASGNVRTLDFSSLSVPSALDRISDDIR